MRQRLNFSKNRMMWYSLSEVLVVPLVEASPSVELRPLQLAVNGTKW